MVAAGGRHAAHNACQTSVWDSLDNDFSVCKIGADPRRISHLRPNCGPCPRESFRHRLYRHSEPFHGHDCEGRESRHHRDRRLWLRARRTRCEEGARWCRRRNGHCRSSGKCPELALGRIAPVLTLIPRRGTYGRQSTPKAPYKSILAGIAVFIGGFAFGHWVTNSDPAFLRILAKSERYKLCYDAAKQQVPRVEVA